MSDWESLRHLAALARHQTVAGAARALRVEHATVSRRLAALERELDIKLLDRRGRKVELTTHGRELVFALERMQAEADSIDRLAAGRRTSVSGNVTITAPPALGTAMLAPVLVELRERHPDLRLHVVAETRQSELQRREADIAIRLSEPDHPDFHIIKLGIVNFRLYALPSYLASIPRAQRVFIGYDESMDRAPQQLAMMRLAQNRPVVIRANSVELQMNLACEGGGMAMLPDFLVQGKELIHAGIEVTSREACLVIHSDIMGSGPVRVVSQALETALRKRLGDKDLAAHV